MLISRRSAAISIATLTLIASALTAVPASASGCAPSDFAGGTGIQAAPFQISTATQLRAIRECANTDNWFVQTANIDLSSNWTTISQFVGHYDGGGKKISGLTVTNSMTSGLFDQIQNSVFTNVEIEAVANFGDTFTSNGVLAGRIDTSTVSHVTVRADVTSVATFSGVGLVAGLVNDSTLSNITVGPKSTGFVSNLNSIFSGMVAGRLSNSSLTTAAVSGEISSASPMAHLGSAVGYLDTATISGVTSQGPITGVGPTVGGIAGYATNSSVHNSTHTGAITHIESPPGEATGGVLGYASNSTVTASGQTGNVSGLGFTGGIVGYQGSGSAIDGANVSGAISGTNHVGGISGNQVSPISNANFQGSVTGDMYLGGISGYCSSYMGFNSNFEFVETPSPITNVSVNGAITATHLDSDLSGWAMAGGLVGYATSCATTNGKVNATVSGKSFTGGAIGYASELDIANVQVVATVTGTGDNAGGLLGYASTINISDSSASGSVTGGAGVFGSIGGFAGYANNVTVTRAFAAEVVTGVTRTGGFFGAANGASVTDAYVTGTVTNPDEYIGNFAGSAGGLNLTRVYIANRGTGADIDIVGINSSAPSMVDVLQSSGIDQSVGRFTEIPMKTSAQMKRAQTFREIGWDFETVWMMNPPSNGGMPMLRSISGINACVVKSFSPVLFAKGSVKLNAAARERIRRIAAAIAFGPCSKLKITGYTSTVEGKGKRKTKLSKLKSIAAKRAAVVQTYLTAQLVALGDSFTTVLSNGNRQNPVASNKTSRGQAKNRRVVISILR